MTFEGQDLKVSRRESELISLVVFCLKVWIWPKKHGGEAADLDDS